MAKRMRTDFLYQTGPARGFLYGLIDHAGINMMPSDDIAARICRQGVCWKYILPAPLFCGIRIFPGKGMGQIDRSAALVQIVLMSGLDLGQMALEKRND